MLSENVFLLFYIVKVKYNFYMLTYMLKIGARIIPCVGLVKMIKHAQGEGINSKALKRN